MIIFFKCLMKKDKSVKLLPLSIKSVNPIKKYLYITESYACILEIFVKIVDLLIKDILINFQISFGMCSTPKLLK